MVTPHILIPQPFPLALHHLQPHCSQFSQPAADLRPRVGPLGDRDLAPLPSSSLILRPHCTNSSSSCCIMIRYPPTVILSGGRKGVYPSGRDFQFNGWLFSGWMTTQHSQKASSVQAVPAARTFPPILSYQMVKDGFIPTLRRKNIGCRLKTLQNREIKTYASALVNR